MIDGNIDVVSLTGDITDSVSLEGELLPIGPKGDKGDPGFSPVVTTSKSGKTTTVKFETATGNVYAYIQDGEDGQGSGDMLTDVYDQNKNGIVDNAEKVNNHTVEKDVPANAVFTDTVYDDTEVRSLINAKPNFSDIPTKVSDLTNDSGFIDNTVNNLTNYYLKNETYTKAEINNLIAQIPGFNVEVVQTLPVSDIDPHTIYLVPKTGSTGDIYDEYLYINNSWELIGNTAVDLTNYVKKTDYATNSTGGVIKTDTSTYGTAMYSGYLTGSTKTYAQYGSSANALFVSKGTLENVITGKELVNKDANNLTNYANVNESAQTTETNVSSATFTNILEAPMDIDLKGNTLQNGTPTPSSPIPINNVSGDNDIVIEGKNLFNPMIYDTTASHSNCTADITNTTINVIPTGNSYLGSAIKFPTYVNDNNKPTCIEVKPSTTYTFSINNSGNSYVSFIDSNYQAVNTVDYPLNNLTSYTFTTPSNCKYVMFRLGKNSGTTPYTFENIQLEENETATTYEAYNGTTYNIDLPVENLCNGINQNVWVSGSYDLVGVGTSNSGLIIATNGGKYTISTTTTQARYRACCIDTLPTTQQSVTGYNGVLYDNTNRTITIDTSGHNYLAVDATDLTKIQVEQGTKANTYTPYGTTPIKLNKIGTYQDYIYKENDKWYLHKEIGVEVFNGTESWQDWSTSSTGRRFALDKSSVIKPPPNNETNADILSNYYVVKTGTQTYNSNVGISVMASGYIAIYDGINSTLNDFKNWLGTHNVNVKYALQTPTNTEITYTPLIEQLESIKNAMSKEGTTNVNQVNNDAPFILDLSVFNDTYNGRYQSLLEMYKRLKETE